MYVSSVIPGFLDRPNVFCRRIALLLLLPIDRRVFTINNNGPRECA